MTPTASSELKAYHKRIRKEAKKRDRQFAPRSVDTGFVVGIVLGMVALGLVYLAWRLA